MPEPDPKPEPESAPIACVGCGAMNPPGAEACSGCGHRFADPGAVPTPEAAPAPPASAREIRPPSTGGGSAYRPILIVAGLVAIGAGLIWYSRPMGAMFLAAAGFATIWTLFAATRRGRTLTRGEGVLVFSKSLGGAFLVLMSSAIAFVATCFPIGLILGGNGPEDQLGGSLVPAFAVGVLAAAIAGGFMTSLLLKNRRRPAPKGPPGEDLP